MYGFLIRCGVTGIAVLIASQVVPGIEIHSLAAGLVTILVLAFLNALVRPMLYLLSAPFIVLTLGLFMVLINASLLHLSAFLVKGFSVDGFWSSIGGAILISLVSGVLNLWISERGHIEVATVHRGRKIRHIN